MVRDADFNVYQDIAGTQNAGNGNRIRNWSDRSGNGVTATIGNDNSRPTFSTLNPFFNSRSAFRFTRSNGAADELNRLVTNKFPVSNDMTIVISICPVPDEVIEVGPKAVPASDQVIIVIRSPIRIPTAISPNGDGANDVWIVSGLKTYSEFLVLVYNRYGNEVHRQQNSFDPGMVNEMARQCQPEHIITW